MTEHKIRIGADFKSITKGFQELNQTINGISRTSHKIKFDKSFIRDLGRDLKTHIGDLRQDTDKLGKQLESTYSKLEKAYKKGTDPKRIKTLQKEFNTLSRSMSDNMRQLETLKRSSMGSQISGVGGKGASGMIRGVGSLMSGRMGMLGRGAAMLGPLGLGVGAVVGGLGMAYGLGAGRRRIAGEGLALRGMGIRSGEQIENIRETGIRTGTGFTPTESLQQAIQLERQVGARTGQQRRELGGQTALGFTQELGRTYGMDPNDLAGMAGGLRKTGLSPEQSLRQLQDIFTQGTAMGVERARLPEFARTQISVLEEQAATGVASIEGLQGLNALLSKSPFFSANFQRSQTIRQGLETAFTSKEGPGAMAAFGTIKEIGGPDMGTFGTIKAKRMGLLKFLEKAVDEGKIKDIGEGIKIFVEKLSELKVGRKVDIKNLEKGSETWDAITVGLQDVMKTMDPVTVEKLLESLKETGTVSKEYLKSQTKAAKESSRIFKLIKKSSDMQMKNLEAVLSETQLDIGDMANAVTSGVAAGLNKFFSDIGDEIVRVLDPTNWPGMIKGMTKANIGEKQAKAMGIAKNMIKQEGGVEAALGIASRKLEGTKSETIVRGRFGLGGMSMVTSQQEEQEMVVKALQTIMGGGRNINMSKPQSPEERVQEERTQQELRKVNNIKTSKQVTEEIGADTLPGTNVLVTPMNKLRGSIDTLNDSINKIKIVEAVGGRKNSKREGIER